MTEASKPLASYASIEDIFTRELSPNKRLVTGSYVASADGILELSRSALSGEDAVQAKGLTYSLGELIFGQKDDTGRGVFAPRWFTTVYLAPHNYHRVHAPFSCSVSKIRYIPGRLWPVNRPAVRAIARLFCRNERLVFDCQLENGAKAWVVMVGAFNVGRMVTRLNPEFVTNSLARQFQGSDAPRELTLPRDTTVAVGEELGIFMLGSTTVVVMDELAVNTLKPREILGPETVSMGHSLSV
jgi:phosphatidylserine decarboxylase